MSIHIHWSQMRQNEIWGLKLQICFSSVLHPEFHFQVPVAVCRILFRVCCWAVSTTKTTKPESPAVIVGAVIVGGEGFDDEDDKA